jgi:hypothetical protein
VSPPEREKPALADRPSLECIADSHSTACGPRAVFGALRRRPHRAPVGHYPRGYREGYAAALRWTQRELNDHLGEIGRARLGAVVARSEAS